jgi:hypothetical protein
VPVHAALVVNLRPSRFRGVMAVDGTVSVTVFHAPAVKLPVGFDVQPQL